MSTENASALAEGQPLPADTSQQTNVTETGNQETQVEERRFTQAELEEKLQKRLAKEKRQSEARHQDLLREIEALKLPKTAETVESKPKREDFGSYEEHLEAVAEWRADQRVNKRMEEERAKSEKKEQETSKARAAEKFDARVSDVIEAGRKAYADFDAVINAAVRDEILPTKGPLYEAMMDSDHGEKLSYYLAKHEDEAERIQKLSVYAQLRELGKLEDKLSAKKEPRETMEPIGGRTSTTSGLRDDAPMDAWVKARNKQANSR